MKSTEKIKRLCNLCMLYGNSFEKEVANTVIGNNYTATSKQEYFLCSGASFKGGSPYSTQHGDNDYDRDSY